jgi:hypothetical protein
MPTRRGTSRTALGLNVLARVPRRGRIWRHQQRHYTPRCVVRPTPGLLPSSAPLPPLLNRSGCRATISRIQPHLTPPPSPPAQACARGPPTALRLHRSAGSSTTSAAVHAGAARLPAGANLQPQPAGSQDNGNGKLVLPQLNRLHEAFKRSQVSPPASSSSQDQPTRPRPIPSQRRLTQQLTKEWPQYKALRQRYAGTRFEEQRQLHLPQKHKATVPDSTLRVEMNGLEEQADHAQARDLYWKPLSWLGAIRPTSANDAFDPTLWTTFVSTTLGVEVPVLGSLPRRNKSPLAQCGCKKHAMNFHGDHTATCTAHSVATKAHDWMVSVLGPLFRTAGHTVRTQHGVTASASQRRGDVEIRSYLRDQAGSRSLVFDLSISHHRVGSSSHVHQNGLLSHPQDLDAPLRVAAQRKINSYRQQYADNQNISFLPRHHEHKHTYARRVFASSFSTGPPGDRGALDCRWNAIATQQIGLVQARGILPVPEEQSRTRGGQSSGAEDQPQY